MIVCELSGNCFIIPALLGARCLPQSSCFGPQIWFAGRTGCRASAPDRRAIIGAAWIPAVTVPAVAVVGGRSLVFWRLVSAWVVERARRPLRPRAGIAQVSGVFSAFLVMMWVVVTARVLEITGRLRPKPIFVGSQ
jgi:hypothetical protein